MVLMLKVLSLCTCLVCADSPHFLCFHAALVSFMFCVCTCMGVCVRDILLALGKITVPQTDRKQTAASSFLSTNEFLITYKYTHIHTSLLAASQSRRALTKSHVVGYIRRENIHTKLHY